MSRRTGPALPPAREARGPRRRVRRRTARLVAALVYLGAVLALLGGAYLMWVAPEQAAADVERLPPAEEEAGGVAGAEAGAEGSEAPAVQARRGVFRLDSPAGVLGSAFVAWVAGGRGFLITAYPAVQSVVADGFGELVVRRGNSRWQARPVRSDKLTGLVLLRIEGRPGAPLWTEPRSPGLAHGEVVRVADAAGPPASGAVSVVDGSISLDVPWDPLHLGAPVLTADGRLAGVVSGTSAGGQLLITPIEYACGRIRRC